MSIYYNYKYNHVQSEVSKFMTISYENENSAYLTYYVGRCTEIPRMYIRKFIIPPFLLNFKRNESTTFNYRNRAYPYTNTTNQTILYYD